MAEDYPEIQELRPPEGAEPMPIKAMSVEVPVSGQPPLYSLEEARKAGINGEIVCEIVLPSAVEGLEDGRRLAVVDFGQFTSAENRKPMLFSYLTQTELPEVGTTSTRYGLMGINYHSPDGGFNPYHKLPLGEAVEIGRADSSVNYDLGLTEAQVKDLELSRKHLSVGIDHEGRLKISDHDSLNGTTVIFPGKEKDVQTDEGQTAAAEKSAVARGKRLGSLGLRRSAKKS